MTTQFIISMLPLLGCAVLVVVLVALVSNFEKIKKKVKDFLREKECGLEKANSENAHGILFGKQKKKVVYSPTDDEGHVAVFGGSGLGKTSALLIPTLRAWTGTSFTIDVSGDICRNVEMPNKIVYEPENPESTPYNVFGAIDSLADEDDQNEELELLAYLLMPENDKMADAARFFNTEGRKILTAALMAFYHAGLDFIAICEKIFSSSWKELFTAIDGTGYAKASQFINSFVGASEQNTAGCKQSADAAIKLFATNERMKRTIRRPQEGETSFTPDVLETSNVFIVVKDKKLDLYAPLLHILTAQSLAFFADRSEDSKTTILFTLDEFSSLGKMEIRGALQKFRKRKVRIIILTQSLADIDSLYSETERRQMMENIAFTVVLGVKDPATQAYFAELIGHEEIKKLSISTGASGTTRTEVTSREWAVEPEKLARMGDKLVLLYAGGYLKLRKNFYYGVKSSLKRLISCFKRR